MFPIIPYVRHKKILDKTRFKTRFIHWYYLAVANFVIYLDCFSHAGLLSANKHFLNKVFPNKHFPGMCLPIGSPWSQQISGDRFISVIIGLWCHSHQLSHYWRFEKRQAELLRPQSLGHRSVELVLQGDEVPPPPPEVPIQWLWPSPTNSFHNWKSPFPPCN